MAEANRTCMRMRGNHRGPIYLYKHICRERQRIRGKDRKRKGIKAEKERQGSKQDGEGKDVKIEKEGLKEGYDEERKRQGERDSLEEKKTGRKAVWCFNRKIRAKGAMQAWSHHNGSHLRMLLQAWLRLWLMLLGLQQQHWSFLLHPWPAFSSCWKTVPV